MRVKVLFFGILKDLAGRSQDQIQLGEGARLLTVSAPFLTPWTDMLLPSPAAYRIVKCPDLQQAARDLGQRLLSACPP